MKIQRSGAKSRIRSVRTFDFSGVHMWKSLLFPDEKCHARKNLRAAGGLLNAASALL